MRLSCVRHGRPGRPQRLSTRVESPQEGIIQFFLGTDAVHWLTLTDVPLMVSQRGLAKRRTLPVPQGRWCLDSGGFTELFLYDEYRTTQEDYVACTRRYLADMGRMEWCAPQDWMCEPFMLAKTGLTLDEHLRRTVRSYVSLVETAPEVPWIPVVQGWRTDDYLRCMDLYAKAGVDLPSQATVGIGSVCRRQHTNEIEDVFRTLRRAGLNNMHGFGVKVSGLARYGHYLHSADSMAWSRQARWDACHKVPPTPPCEHRSCSHCLVYALRWRDRVLRTLDHEQLSLADAGEWVA